MIFGIQYEDHAATRESYHPCCISAKDTKRVFGLGLDIEDRPEPYPSSRAQQHDVGQALNNSGMVLVQDQGNVLVKAQLSTRILFDNAFLNLVGVLHLFLRKMRRGLVWTCMSPPRQCRLSGGSIRQGADSFGLKSQLSIW